MAIFRIFDKKVIKNIKILESWATPKLVKRSLGTKSQIPDPQSQIPGLRSRIPNYDSRIPDPKFQIPKDCKSGSLGVGVLKLRKQKRLGWRKKIYQTNILDFGFENHHG